MNDRRYRAILPLVSALCICLPWQVRAEVVPATIFADHMVLQRDMPVPVWGGAKAGEVVTVTFAGQTRKTTAGADGKWQVRLDAMKARATPATMSIAGKNSITIKDVLVGEIWLGSGQSNMTMRFRPEVNPDDFANSDQPAIRTANVGPGATLQPQDSVAVKWSVCSPRTIAKDFSAVGYFFVKRLHDELHVPVALVHSSWEGTPIEPWISREALLANPLIEAFARRQIAALADRPADDQAFLPKIQAWEAKYHCGDTSTKGVDEGWGKPTYDASAWKKVTLETDFRAAGLPYGGIVWFRKEVNVPAAAAGKAFEFNPGFTVDNVSAFWNGVPLKEVWNHPKYHPHGQGFAVPGELVQAGKNVASVRIFGHTEGHFWCTGKQMRIPGIELDPKPDEWQAKVEVRFPDVTPEALAALPKVPIAEPQSTASCLFNGQIRPLIPFAIRGAIWYQGESSWDRSQWYATTLTTLIRDWRARWGEGDFPFYIVQLANISRPPEDPEEGAWARVREAQLQVSREVPNTGLAVALDIGEEKDIHPRNKRATGNRLALLALAKTYGMAVASSGPIYEWMRLDGGKIRVKFSSLGGGLVAKEGALKQFAIAGADKKFVWAEARIEGDQVVVWSAKVAKPVAVRYAWAQNPQGCNLYNTAGLPASPFRTDAW
jgi:sialate O-acetylesterase